MNVEEEGRFVPHVLGWLLAVVICLPLLVVQLFHATPRRVRVLGSLITASLSIIVLTTAPGLRLNMIVALVGSAVAISNRQFSEIREDVYRRRSSQMPPLMSDPRELHLWFNPIWLVTYRRRLYRDPAFLATFDDDHYDWMSWLRRRRRGQGVR